jgi:hypothetical protein
MEWDPDPTPHDEPQEDDLDVWLPPEPQLEDALLDDWASESESNGDDFELEPAA